MSSTQTQSTDGRLLAEFPPASYDDWRKLVESELKGAPFDKKMFTPTYEGITLKPIYRREDTAALPHVNSYPGFAPFVRGATASGYIKYPWDVSQEIAYSNPTEFNQAARNYVTRGLTALNMVLDKATRRGQDPDWAQPDEVGYGGLSVSTLSDLDRALDGIDLDKITLLVRSGGAGMPFAALLAALARKRKKTAEGLRGCIEMDPLGVLSHEGKLPQSLDSAYREMGAFTLWAAECAPKLQTICVHSRAWNEAGSNAVQELAFSLATAVEYLRQMSKRGLTVNVTAPRTRFAITVGTKFFTEISKLRALRMLWARAVAAAGGDENAQKLSLHVRTSRWNKTVYDPYNNMLRTTIEAFAGVLGGCDSMQVGAFDEILRQPDDFSQRIARNTQLVLQKECNLEHVIDPAGGSWYVEVLTSELATRAWSLFQEIEKLGGMEAALRAGFPQKAVTEKATERLKAVTTRRDTIVGVNQYANIKENLLECPQIDAVAFHKRRVQQIASHRTSLEDDESEAVLASLAKIVVMKDVELFEACITAVTAGATIGEVTRAIRINDSPCAPITPVCITRSAAPIEHVRGIVDRFIAKGNERPTAFLCNMGSLKEHKARADFARGFLAVGGYDVISPEGFKTTDAAIAAFAQSKAKIAVICSLDDNYPALVPPLVAGIRAARPDTIIVLAGYPQDQLEAHKKTGVDEFIHVRADVCDTLNKFNAKLGIA